MDKLSSVVGRVRMELQGTSFLHCCFPCLQLFKATVSNGKLYILKVQAGDKRWFKGTDKEWYVLAAGLRLTLSM
jgi:hypothetical protein